MSGSISAHPRILDHFSTCEDPRTRPVQYPLLEIIITVVLATLCGEEGWEGYADWGQDKLSFLKRLLPFESGIPCPDTFRRLFERINPEQFLSSFVSWAEELKVRTAGQICIDGKALRGTMNGKKPLHIVSAWSEQNRIVLAAVKTDAKSNEITAIKDLLDVLVLRTGDIITIDAIGCQKLIVSKVRDQGADYVIALKKNQSNLASEVENYFDQAVNAADYTSCISCETQSEKHGRKDRHEIWVSSDVNWLPQLQQWNGLQSVIMVLRRWEENGTLHQEKRYYISSLQTSAEKFSHIIRRHWSIENELHWHLDVTFREDASQIGATANGNLRVARMISLDLLRNEQTFTRGLKAKMRKCLRSEDYLRKVLNVGNF